MATELTDGVWQLELRAANAYLIDDDTPTLVDAGTPWDESTIRDEIGETGVAIPDIGRVLLTHYDLDHVGTLAALTPDLDATVYAGEFDAAILRGDRSPPWTNHKGAFQRLVDLFVSTPDLTIEPIEDGDSIGSFTAYDSPGHTPGHMAYVSDDHSVGVLGDLVTESEGELEASGWAMSYDTDDVAISIIELADRTPDFDIACMGHGTPVTEGGHTALVELADELYRSDDGA